MKTLFSLQILNYSNTRILKYPAPFFLLFIIYLTSIILPGAAFSQNETQDVVYLKNGSIIKGTIVEQIPNESIKIETSDGSVFVYDFADVKKIAREVSQKPSLPGKTSNKKSNFGFKAGLITGGMVSVGKQGDIDVGTSYSFGGFWENILAPSFFWGFALDFNGINYKHSNESSTLINMSTYLKTKIDISDNVILRPGVSILGYGILTNPSSEGDNSNNLTLGAMLELVITSNNNLSFLGEIGMVASPLGGNKDYDITFSPKILIRGGIMF